MGGGGCLSEGGLAVDKSGLLVIGGWAAGSNARVPPGGYLGHWSSDTC